MFPKGRIVYLTAREREVLKLVVDFYEEGLPDAVEGGIGDPSLSMEQLLEYSGDLGTQTETLRIIKEKLS